jgi:hypothetical protein
MCIVSGFYIYTNVAELGLLASMNHIYKLTVTILPN